ncbi:hypothetical protein DL990_00635 [Amycolatopsis sp. WAC 01416]|uniref:hypothetical protein n=1 Tax=Amycolatopsis sp. WAC 01416 TaxID=2203196 RepID=UPI000F77E79E|nr:hypothetical protein [Amycolatopsis sp. WAC 01416]RSN37579.1 hypothetical protein DL990_00635 [Amycolatopsis sp. WAC 01416]
MPSSDLGERPAEWPPGDGGKYKAALVFVVLLGVACVPVGFGFVAIGKAGALKYALLLAALFLLTAVYGLVTRIRPGHRHADIAITTYDGHPATEIRYSQAAFTVLTLLMVCLTALCALGVWDFLSAGEEVPAAPVGAALMGLAALFFSSFLVFVVAGRLQRGRVVLARQGIFQRGRAFSSFLPWEAFAGAKAAYNGTPEVLVIAYTNAPWDKRRLGGIWQLDKLPPAPMIEIDTTSFALDPTVVYHLVRFYVENPAARAELGTDASLRRFSPR